MPFKKEKGLNFSFALPISLAWFESDSIFLFFPFFLAFYLTNHNISTKNDDRASNNEKEIHFYGLNRVIVKLKLFIFVEMIYIFFSTIYVISLLSYKIDKDSNKSTTGIST